MTAMYVSVMVVTGERSDAVAAVRRLAETRQPHVGVRR